MLRLHDGLNTVLFKALVRSHAAAFEIHLNQIFGQSYLHLLSDKVKRNRVFIQTVRDQIVVSDGLLFPHRGLISALRQRQHKFLFLR